MIRNKTAYNTTVTMVVVELKITCKNKTARKFYINTHLQFIRKSFILFLPLFLESCCYYVSHMFCLLNTFKTHDQQQQHSLYLIWKGRKENVHMLLMILFDFPRTLFFLYFILCWETITFFVYSVTIYVQRQKIC